MALCVLNRKCKIGLKRTAVDVIDMFSLTMWQEAGL